MLAGFIFCALVGYYLLDSVAKLLNLRRLGHRVPDEFADVFDASRYQRAQEYARVNTWFELTVSTISLIALLLFWSFRGFEILDLWIRGFQFPPVLAGLFYFGALAVARELLSLPFEIHHTFVIEERYGFNRTKWSTFVVDHLKQWVISGVLLGGLLALVLSLFEKFGTSAWLIAWICVAAVSIFVTYLAPTMLLPLFFKFSPLPEGELRDRVTELCRQQKFPMRELLVIDGSRRSSKANAFFTGFGANKRIALYDTLIQNHTVPELVAVLAHEIAHYKKRHIVQHFLFAQLNLFLLFGAASLCVSRPELLEAFGVSHPSYYVGLALFFILVQPAAVLIGVLSNSWSRRHEFEADHFAAESLQDPDPLITALKKLSRDSLSNLSPHPLLVGLHYSHPPVSERIAALRRFFSDVAAQRARG
jgi:STE24 endopeptidase